MLFDPGYTYSYESAYFSLNLDLMCDSLDMPIHISTLIGDSVVVVRVYRCCIVTLIEYDTHVDLKVLYMVDFDVILWDGLVIFISHNLGLSCQDSYFSHFGYTSFRVEGYS